MSKYCGHVGFGIHARVEQLIHGRSVGGDGEEELSWRARSF